MKNFQIRAFFLDKEPTPTPLTNRLIAGGYRQKSGGYIDRAKKEGLEKPSQYWHLIHSWSDNSELNASFNKHIQCGELIFWMAEVSKSLSEEELALLVEQVLLEPDNRKRGNQLIQDKCFDKITEIVECYGEYK